jgi:hypothetical protein
MGSFDEVKRDDDIGCLDEIGTYTMYPDLAPRGEHYIDRCVYNSPKANVEANGG